MAAARRQTFRGTLSSAACLWLMVAGCLGQGRRPHLFDCDFEVPCPHWHWLDSDFKLTNDSEETGGRDGQILWTSGSFETSSSGPGEWPRRAELRSDPLRPPTLARGGHPVCALEFWLQTGEGASLMLSTRNLNHTLVIKTFPQLQGWRDIHVSVSAGTQPFQLILEAVLEFPESHLAVDRIRLTGCSDDDDNEESCGADSDDVSGRGFLCPSTGKCLGRDKICDLSSDCPPDDDDERQECDRLPPSAYCNFESGQCGWRNKALGSETGFFLVEGDDHTFNNKSGHSMKAIFSGKDSVFGSEAELDSAQFEAPPYYHRNVHSAYYNSCQVRFWFAQQGQYSQGFLNLQCVQEAPAEIGCGRNIWEYTTKSKPGQGQIWRKAVVAIPPLYHSYSLRLTANRGLKHKLGILLDDITLSPECFGIGVPENESNPYNTGSSPKEPTNITRRYTFGSCGVSGTQGPGLKNCRMAYGMHNSSTQITISDQRPGVQLWTVPETGQYVIFASGASGGTGVRNTATPSRGAMVRGLFNLTQGEVIAILVGQKGTDACSPHTSKELQRECRSRNRRRGVSSLRSSFIKNGKVGGGGGGGGATFVYKPHGMIPLLVASGAGGLSAESEKDPSSKVDPDGAGPNSTILPVNGAQVTGPEGSLRVVIPGPGGGWNDTTSLREGGRSLLEGGAGGESCNAEWSSHGGFGGGGGSCVGGGGGGGFRGGDAGDESNGQGGVSFISQSALYPLAEPSFNEGQGSVSVFPTQRGCGCQHLCLPLDLQDANRVASSPAFLCICPDGQTLDGDGRSCLGTQGPLTKQVGSDSFQLPTHHLVVIILCILVTVAVILFFLLLALNRYRRKQTRELSHEPLRGNPEVQLSRLRQAAAAGGTGSAAGAVTEYNPNYEFGGSTCTLQDLREIPRENLTLVKALGQGAFGEVYQGYLANAPGETSEIAVAVKTLPEVSSGQAEQDFMLEALIMSKFTHTNIVRFLGVCFQKLPRFIVLELLPGGDLKSFLRETRPKPAKPSPLSMADLLRLAIEVAKGCQYLEENHFIHRDIAARNCLLTSKGPDRVVKIADFGMARDIYKADYYRKGGKAMLPVKWMPPEAFLDGVFTSKTDVWSFGVLLWEVLSMGYMPYPGRGNQEVMQLVTSGGRLEPPANCPGPVYHIMMQCWHPLPDERPAFATILERLGYCVQDPDVVSAPLPVFHRPPSMEKDATLMRPPDGSDGCLQVIQQRGPELQSPGSEDYLIPMPSSNYSLSTERTELQSSAESVDKLLRLDEEILEGATGGSDICWAEHDTQAETSFSKGSLEALPLAPASPREPQPQPLDAAALNRLTNRPLPYVNVDVTGMSSFEDNAANC